MVLEVGRLLTVAGLPDPARRQRVELRKSPFDNIELTSAAKVTARGRGCPRYWPRRVATGRPAKGPATRRKMIATGQAPVVDTPDRPVKLSPYSFAHPEPRAESCPFALQR